jgi:hypothetical protein
MISSIKIKGSTKQIIRKASENKELIQWATQLEIQQVQLGVGFFERWKTSNLVGMWNIQQVGFVLFCAIIMKCFTYLHYPTLSSWKGRSTANFIFWFWRPTEREPCLHYKTNYVLWNLDCWFVAGVSWFVPIQVSCSLISVV